MRCFSLILVFVSSLAFSQISLTDLKRAGVKSEEDLKKLGVSTEEINDLKREYVQSQQSSKALLNSNESSNDIKPPKMLPPEHEKPIMLESTKNTNRKDFVFGQSLFNAGAVSIQKNSDRIKANDNYIIGSGDRVNVTIWGFSEFSDDFTVDDLGNISPKLVGKINLKGKTFKDARSIIKSKFSRVYDLKNSQIGIELSYSKVISVNLMGEVNAPGTYSIPSINSAFNVLSLSNGPNQMGSVRNISIIRGGNIIDSLDVYQFMNTPTNSSPIYLEDGDFILVPTLGNVVTIHGEVQRVGKYETKKGETLADLIGFAGNFTAYANQKNLTIIRQTTNGKIVQSYSFENAKNILIHKGDEVFVPKNSQHTVNKVTLKGEVNAPGIFEFKNNETVTNLLSRANGLTPEAYLKTAHIYRLDSELKRKIISLDLTDNDLLNSTKIKDLDEIFIFSKTSFIDTNHVTINGLVRKPGKVEFKKEMSLSDLITIAGGASPQADLKRLEIERVNFLVPPSDSLNYVQILFKTIESDADFKLEPFDIVNVRSLPNFKFQESITIEGEVKYPGAYSLSGNKVKISDILERAGGLTELAYAKKAFIEREEDSLGIILLDLNFVLKKVNSYNNYTLRPGDKVIVPKINDIVSISGAIGAKFINKEDKINVAYIKRRRASFYIKKYAGGYDKKADKRSVYSVTLNGQVKRSKFFGLFKPRIESGDKIIVSYLPKKEKKENEGRINWNNQIENFTIKLTGLATLWVLVSNVTN